MLMYFTIWQVTSLLKLLALMFWFFCFFFLRMFWLFYVEQKKAYNIIYGLPEHLRRLTAATQ